MRISSEFPWPETCTGAISWCSTSAPARASWLIVSCTRSSFPGTAFAEMITVSPRSTSTVGWSWYAIARERGHRLALAARAEDEHLVRRVVVELVGLHEGVVGHLHVAERARDVEVLPHRPPDDAHLAAGLEGDVDRLLHTVDVRGERSDEYPPFAQRDDLAERLPDEPLRPGVAGPLGVRRVSQQEVDAEVAELGETAHVGLEAVDGRVVDLVVRRVEDAPAAHLDDDAGVVGYRVRHPHELEAERPFLDRPVLRPHLDELRAVGQLVLGELRLDEAERQPGADDPRHVHLAQEVRQAAHVILVRVREHDGIDWAPAVGEVRDVGEYEVDAEVLVAREREAGVDHEAAAVALDHRHVLSHLAEAAERDDADGVGHRVPVYGADAGAVVELGGDEQPEAVEAGPHLLDLVLGRLDERQPQAADLVAEEVESRLDGDRVRDDLQEVVGGLQLVVDAPGLDVVSGLVQPDHLLHLRADDVRVHADTAGAADLEERVDEVVVARVQGEAGLLDDEPRLDEIVVRLLDGSHRLDLGELRHRLRLDVDDDPAGDVVDDHRLVAERRDRLEVLDDSARRRLRVVRRDDEEAVDADLRAPPG